MLQYYSLKLKLEALTFLHLFPGWMCKLRATHSGNLMPFRYCSPSVHSYTTLLVPLHSSESRSQFTDRALYFIFFSSSQSEDTSLGISRSLCPAESMSCKNTIANPNYCLPGSIPLSPSLPFFPPSGRDQR